MSCANLWVFQFGCENKSTIDVTQTSQFQVTTSITNLINATQDNVVNIRQAIGGEFKNIECKKFRLGNIATVTIRSIQEITDDMTAEINSSIKAETDIEIQNLVAQYQDFLASPIATSTLTTNLRQAFYAAIDSSVTRETLSRIRNVVSSEQAIKDILIDGLKSEDCEISNSIVVEIFSETIIKQTMNVIVKNDILMRSLARIKSDLDQRNEGVGSIIGGFFSSLKTILIVGGVLVAIIVIVVVFMMLKNPEKSKKLLAAAKTGSPAAVLSAATED